MNYAETTQMLCRNSMWRGFAEKIEAKTNTKEELSSALEQCREIFSKKLRLIREREETAKVNLCFKESRYWSGVYYQIFELREEIERMVAKG